MGPKSRVACFCRAALVCVRSEMPTLAVSETRASCLNIMGMVIPSGGEESGKISRADPSRSRFGFELDARDRMNLPRRFGLKSPVPDIFARRRMVHIEEEGACNSYRHWRIHLDIIGWPRTADTVET